MRHCLQDSFHDRINKETVYTGSELDTKAAVFAWVDGAEDVEVPVTPRGLVVVAPNYEAFLVPFQQGAL